MKELKGKNYFLYILLSVNLVLGLIIFYLQKFQMEKPREYFPSPTQIRGLGFKAIVKLPMIHSNILPTRGLKRYLRIAPVLILEQEQVMSEIKIKETVIRDKIISYLNQVSEDQVLSDNGVSTVRENIKEIINKILSQNKVTMVYFREFRVN